MPTIEKNAFCVGSDSINLGFLTPVASGAQRGSESKLSVLEQTVGIWA
jgi:hypothetical protein